jgi:hypothetical protein
MIAKQEEKRLIVAASRVCRDLNHELALLFTSSSQNGLPFAVSIHCSNNMHLSLKLLLTIVSVVMPPVKNTRRRRRRCRHHHHHR